MGECLLETGNRERRKITVTQMIQRTQSLRYDARIVVGATYSLVEIHEGLSQRKGKERRGQWNCVRHRAGAGANRGSNKED